MKTYAVFGLGKSGKATVDYLKAQGNKVYAWDDNADTRRPLRHENLKEVVKTSRKSQGNFLWAACDSITLLLSLAVEALNGVFQKDRETEYTHPDYWDWTKIDALVLSPGIPLTHPKPHYIAEAANKAGKPIICDIEILYQDNKDATFIGITGTNGKSTTTALTAHILKENGYDMAVGGNLGTPALTLGKHNYYVIETSSYQLDLLHETRFNVAVWLNISPDHIDRHGDINGYIKAKKRIFKNGNDVAIIGTDDAYSKAVQAEIKGSLAFSKTNLIGEFPNLPGAHNMQNINAAYLAAKAVGIAHDKIIAAIKTFPGLEHRIEKVAVINGVTYINDSKATNADSSQYALACFDEIYWIIGGVPKAGGISPLTEFFPRIKKAFVIGQATDEFVATLEGKVPYSKSGTLENAVKEAYHEAKSGVVLLSPACASFDQFKNFEERGNAFKKFVHELNSCDIKKVCC